MSTLSIHLKSLKLKNPWYVEHYGLKHVITEANYRQKFTKLGIKIIEERFHHSVDNFDENFCSYGVFDHWHYIVDVPMNILTKAYDHKKNWATIVGISHNILTPPKNHIKTQEHYEVLMNFLSEIPSTSTNDYFSDEDEYSEIVESNKQLTEQLRELEKKKNFLLDKISKKRVHLTKLKKSLKEFYNEQRAQEALAVKEEARRERQRNEISDETYSE